MPKPQTKTKPVRTPNLNLLTVFEDRYGCRIEQFAHTEGVTPEAIGNRVRVFGSPYQRRAKPTLYEVAYGRTLFEIAEELDYHPQQVRKHHLKLGNAYAPIQKVFRKPKVWREAIQTRRYGGVGMCVSWLHPLHPDYQKWRTGELFPETRILSKMSASEIEIMMYQAGWPQYHYYANLK